MYQALLSRCTLTGPRACSSHNRDGGRPCRSRPVLYDRACVQSGVIVAAGLDTRRPSSIYRQVGDSTIIERF